MLSVLVIIMLNSEISTNVTRKDNVGKSAIQYAGFSESKMHCFRQIRMYESIIHPYLPKFKHIRFLVTFHRWRLINEN